MVKDGKGCYVGVERFGIAKVPNSRVIYYGLDEELDATLSGLVGPVILDYSSPSSFSANMVDTRSFRVDCRVIAGWMGGWAYKGSAVVVDMVICTGNKAPQVVDAVDRVVGGLEKDRQDGI
jgi:hypothetical protein